MPSLIPNEYWDYSFRDLMRALVAPHSKPAAIEGRYLEIPGVGRCWPVRSARAALVIALKTLALPPGAAIAVPLYCCPVVFAAIKSAGYTPCFIDSDPDTYCMSAADLAAKGSQASAVIAVHMFGNVCDIPALRRAVPGKPIIEDCAQALGARLGDRSTGLFGEIAVFSFRSGKYISAGEGGALYCSDPAIDARIAAAVSKLKIASPIEEWTHAVKTYLRSALRRKPLWGIIGSRLWRIHGERTHGAATSPVAPARIYAGDYQTTLRRLPKLSSYVEKQRSIADYYARNLAANCEMLSRETPGAYFGRLQYPLRLSTELQCEQFVERLRANQISTSRPQKDIAAVAARHYGYRGDCPQAEQIARTLVAIPCHYALRVTDLEYISRCVNSAWIETKGDRVNADSLPLAASETIAPHAESLKGIAEHGHSL